MPQENAQPSKRDRELLLRLGRGTPDERRQALSRLYERHQPFLASLAKKRLPDEAAARDALACLWRDLASGTAADEFSEGLSARALLAAALNRRILAAHKDTGEEELITQEDLEAFYSGRLTEEELRQKEAERLAMGRAFTLMAEISPLDAELLWRFFKGESALDMARLLPADADSGTDRAEGLDKRLHGKRTGALARFHVLFSRCYREISGGGPEGAGRDGGKP